MDLADIQAAVERLRGRVRRTPLIEVEPVRDCAGLPGPLSLKLENLQITGSFKARGATHKLLRLPPEEARRGLITASGGNHGLAVAYAGWSAGVPATIYLPKNAPPAKATKIRAWGAEVVVEGEAWDDAHRAATAEGKRRGLVYIHPFADPDVIAGQGTVGLEIVEEDPAIEMIVVAIGGGGLIGGIAAAVKAVKPQIRVVGVEPVGAPTLHDSVRAGRVVELKELRTAANTLAARRTDEINLGLVQRWVDEIVLVTDEEMREAARWLWRELGVASELSGAAAVGALLKGKISAISGRRACAVVCGAGEDGLRH